MDFANQCFFQSTATSNNHKNGSTKSTTSAAGVRQAEEEEIAATVYAWSGTSLSKTAEGLLYLATIGSPSEKIVNKEKEGYSGVSNTRAQCHILLHYTLESTRLNSRSLRYKSRLSIANDSPWHAYCTPQLRVTSRIECTIRAVVPLAFDRSAPKLVQAYMLRFDSTTKLRGSDSNSFIGVFDITSLLADSQHNNTRSLVPPQIHRDASSIPKLCSLSKSQQYTEGSPLTSKYEPTMLLLCVYKAEDGHND
ncbi:uncharacterized protein Bfra_005815 [Botrytis fragariae]|uniref:Uncharacterized protein n=1 Tax=Botrytis fragariae TaxID=1964551 RepID=A0A8H6AS80_9HELO|nr:uncharacterized protein Bfra_005815 [Botrytis fragariae]KAF5872455.1 hypothetical protein Bfra_005815 [Botrytis fragariae]